MKRLHVFDLFDGKSLDYYFYTYSEDEEKKSSRSKYYINQAYDNKPDLPEKINSLS